MAISLNSLKTASLVVLFASSLSGYAVASEEANPQLRKGLYAGFSAGAQFLEESDIATDGFAATNVLDFDTGFNVAAQVGYKFGGGFRIEESLGYSLSEASLSGTTGGFTGKLGVDLQNISLMTNLYYDFNTGTRFTPYVGAGAGVNFIDADADAAITGLGSGSVNSDDTGFAYNLMAGANYSITNNITLGLEYRFAGSENPTFKVGGAGIELENQSHHVEAKLAYHF